MFTKHKKCSYCGKIGHKADMKRWYEVHYYGDIGLYWYHEECYMKKRGVVPCLCGKGYVNAATAGSIKPPQGGTGETRRKR